MIHPFCSALQARRRPVPVNTSSRRTGSGLDLGKSSVSDTCLTRSIQRADIRPSAPDVKRGVRRPLTLFMTCEGVYGNSFAPTLWDFGEPDPAFDDIIIDFT